MRGSVRSRRRGVWEVRVYLGRDPETGKKIYKSQTVHGIRRDAEKVCRTLLEEAEEAASKELEPEVPSFGSWLDKWWEAKQRTIAPTTASAWRSSVELYLKPHLGETPINDLESRDFSSLYLLLVDQGLSPARVQKVHTVASVALNAAVKDGVVAVAVTASADVPAVGRKEPVAPSPEEVGVLLRAAEPEADLYAFLMMAANTGARRSELCALRWCDIDVEDRVAVIARSVAKGAGYGATIRQTKTGTVGRVSIGQDAVAAVSRLKGERQRACDVLGIDLAETGFVWSQDPDGARPIYPDTVSARFRALRDRVGLGHVQLRHLRHFSATQLLAAGVDVRTVAGRLRHARPSMTLDRYAAWVPARDREAADLLDGLD